jgi:hypothetical protein
MEAGGVRERLANAPGAARRRWEGRPLAGGGRDGGAGLGGAQTRTAARLSEAYNGAAAGLPGNDPRGHDNSTIRRPRPRPGGKFVHPLPRKAPPPPPPNHTRLRGRPQPTVWPPPSAPRATLRPVSGSSRISDPPVCDGPLLRGRGAGPGAGGTALGTAALCRRDVAGEEGPSIRLLLAVPTPPCPNLTPLPQPAHPPPHEALRLLVLPAANAHRQRRAVEVGGARADAALVLRPRLGMHAGVEE